MRLLPFIDQQRVHHSAQQLCQVLGVVPSRHYAWRQRPATGARGAGLRNGNGGGF